MKIEDLLFGVIELGLLYAISWIKMSYIGSAFWLLFISFSYYLFTVPENPITTKQQAHTENLKTHYYAAGWIAALVIFARVIVQVIDAWKEDGMSDDTVETLEDWGIAPLEDADSKRFWVFIFQVSILVTGFAMYHHLSKRQPPEEDQQEDFFLSPGWTTLTGNVILFLLACCGPTLVTLPFVVFYICSRFIMAFNAKTYSEFWRMARIPIFAVIAVVLLLQMILTYDFVNDSLSHKTKQLFGIDWSDAHSTMAQIFIILLQCNTASRSGFRDHNANEFDFLEKTQPSLSDIPEAENEGEAHGYDHLHEEGGDGVKSASKKLGEEHAEEGAMKEVPQSSFTKFMTKAKLLMESSATTALKVVYNISPFVFNIVAFMWSLAYPSIIYLSLLVATMISFLMSFQRVRKTMMIWMYLPMSIYVIIQYTLNLHGAFGDLLDRSGSKKIGFHRYDEWKTESILQYWGLSDDFVDDLDVSYGIFFQFMFLSSLSLSAFCALNLKKYDEEEPESRIESNGTEGSGRGQLLEEEAEDSLLNSHGGQHARPGTQQEERRQTEGNSPLPTGSNSASGMGDSEVSLGERVQAWKENLSKFWEELKIALFLHSYRICLVALFLAALSRPTGTQDILHCVYFGLFIVYLLYYNYSRKEWWICIIIYTQLYVVTLYSFQVFYTHEKLSGDFSKNIGLYKTNDPLYISYREHGLVLLLSLMQHYFNRSGVIEAMADKMDPLQELESRHDKFVALRKQWEKYDMFSKANKSFGVYLAILVLVIVVLQSSISLVIFIYLISIMVLITGLLFTYDIEKLKDKLHIFWNVLLYYIVLVLIVKILYNFTTIQDWVDDDIDYRGDSLSRRDLGLQHELTFGQLVGHVILLFLASSQRSTEFRRVRRSRSSLVDQEYAWYQKIFYYAIAVLAKHSAKLTLLITFALAISEQALTGFIYLFFVLVIAVIETKNHWATAWMPLCIVSQLFISCHYFFELNLTSDLEGTGAAWVGFKRHSEDVEILNLFYRDLIILIFCVLQRRCQIFYENFGVVPRLFSHQSSMRLSARTTHRSSIDENSGTEMVETHPESFEEKNSAKEIRDESEEFSKTCDIVWKRIGWEVTLFAILMYVFVRLNVLGILVLSLLGIILFKYGYFMPEEVVNDEETARAQGRRIKGVIKMWEILIGLLFVAMLFEYGALLRLPPGWDIEYPWDDWGFGCKDSAGDVRSSKSPYQHQNDYLNCKQNWLIWLDFDKYDYSDLWSDFIAFSMMLIYRNYFKKERDFMYEVKPKSMDENDFTIAHNQARVFMAIPKFYIFTGLHKIILIWLLIVGSVEGFYNGSDLLSMGYLAFALYFLYKENALMRDPLKKWRLLRMYNFTILLFMIMFQVPAIPCPVPHNNREYYSNEECVEEQQESTNRVIDTSVEEDYKVAFIISSQTIGLLKLVASRFTPFKAIFQSAVLLIVLDIQERLFNHPYYKAYVHPHLRREQLNERLRSYLAVQRVHQERYWEYKRTVVDDEVQDSKLTRVMKKLKKWVHEFGHTYSERLMRELEAFDAHQELRDEADVIRAEKLAMDDSFGVAFTLPEIYDIIDDSKEQGEQLDELMIEAARKKKLAYLDELQSRDGIGLKQGDESYREISTRLQNIESEELRQWIAVLRAEIKRESERIRQEELKRLEEKRETQIQRLRLKRGRRVRRDQLQQNGDEGEPEERDDNQVEGAVGSSTLAADFREEVKEEPIAEVQEEDNANKEGSEAIEGEGEEVEKMSKFERYRLWLTQDIIKPELFVESQPDFSYTKPESANFTICLYVLMTYSETIVFFTFILDALMYGGLLPLVYPASILFYALLENPQVSKAYWKIMLAYTILLIVVKSFYQLPFFCSDSAFKIFGLSDEYCLSNTQHIESVDDDQLVDRADYILGLYKFRTGIFHGLFWDFMVFVALIWNRYSLRLRGMWRYYDPLADLSVTPRFLFWKPQKVSRQERAELEQDEQVNADGSANGGGGDSNDNGNGQERENSHSNQSPVHSSAVSSLRDNIEIPPEFRSNKSSFSRFLDRLFPSRVVSESEESTYVEFKPGRDVYPAMFTFSLVVMLFMLFFFPYVNQSNDGSITDAFKQDYFAASMVICLAIMIFLIIIDRLLHKMGTEKDELRRHTLDELEEEYTHLLEESEALMKDKEKKLLKDRKAMYSDEESEGPESDYLYQHEPVSLWKDPIFIRFLIFLVIGVAVHVYIFFILPHHNGEMIKHNFAIICFYFLLMGYMVSIALQLKYGASRTTKTNFIMRSNANTNKVAFKAFRAVPFLYEMRVIVDWTISKTSLDMFQWIKLEDLYSNLFECRCTMYARRTQKPGEQRPRPQKILGCGLFTIMLLIVLLPILIFSSLNPMTEENPVLQAQTKMLLETTGSDTDDYWEVYMTDSVLVHNLSDGELNRIEDKYHNFEDEDEDQNYQRIETDTYSKETWNISDPALEALKSALNENSLGFYFTYSWDFTRDYPSDKPTRGTNSVRLSSTQVSQLKEILDDDKVTTTSMIIVNLIPKFLTLTSSEASEISDAHGDSGYREFLSAKVSLVVEDGTKYWSISPVESQSTIKEDEAETTGPVFVVSSTYKRGAFFASGRQISALGLYATVVLTIGQFVRLSLGNLSQKVIFEEMPETDDIWELCESVFLSRVRGNFKREEELYTFLINMYRSPECLLKISGGRLKTIYDKKTE